jgi:hypothetical protein
MIHWHLENLNQEIFRFPVNELKFLHMFLQQSALPIIGVARQKQYFLLLLQFVTIQK